MVYKDFSREQLEEALKEMEKRVEELEEEKERYEKMAKKFKADFENYKKKQGERKKRWQEKAEKDLAKDLISVMDNLERAIMSANEDSSVIQGVKMVADQLYNSLEKRGLQRINAEGEEFDPRLHNAVDTTEHEKENHVVKAKRKGYLYKDKVLREAEVVVGKTSSNN